MSHEIERAGYLAKPAWHRIGQVAMEPMAPHKLLELAGLNYQVHKVPAYVEVLNSHGSGFNEVPNQFHLVRSDDGKVLSENTVTAQYHQIHPGYLADVLQPFYDAGYGTPDAAFTLYGGRSEVVTLRLDMNEDVLGDESKYDNYLVLQNFHGKGAIRGKLVRIRVVCHNTVTAGFEGGADFRISHNSSVQANLTQAGRVWEQARHHIAEQSKALGLLASVEFDTTKAVDQILGITDVREATTQLENKRNDLIAAAQSSPGTAGRTLLDVYNGITWYNTHVEKGRGSKSEVGRIESVFGGTRGKFEEKAFDTLLQLAGA